MEEIWVEWKGPYGLEYIPDRESAFNWGIYAITRVWGTCERLLYIGQSYRQCMLNRVWCHRNDWIYQYRGQMRVRFGTIKIDEGYRHSQQRTKDIEALLIYWHQPIHNTQHRRSYPDRQLLIWNIGRHTPLDKRVCTDDLS